MNEEIATFYGSRATSLSPRKAGFGAILNSAINALEFQVHVLRSHNVQVKVREISQQFIVRNSHKDASSRQDLEKVIQDAEYSSPSNAHAINEIEHLKRKSEIFHYFFKFRNLEELEELRREFITDRTLGVHLRGTDKNGEVAPPSPELILRNIREIVEVGQITNIFLATDDIKYRNLLQNEFGDLIRTLPSHEISKNGKPIHFRVFRRKLNREVLEDIYLLSHCPYLIYSYSNVSYLSLVIGISRFKLICYSGAQNLVNDLQKGNTQGEVI